TCPITENGFIRVVTQIAYHPDPPRPSLVVERLRKFCASDGHHFWADTISLRDESLFVTANIANNKQVTDIYLLGLSRKMGGRLATFDRSINASAVKDGRRHLTVISA